MARVSCPMRGRFLRAHLVATWSALLQSPVRRPVSLSNALFMPSSWCCFRIMHTVCPHCLAAPSIRRRVSGVGAAGFIINDNVLTMRSIVGGV